MVAKAVSGGTHCCMDFCPGQLPTEDVTLLFLPGWYCQALGPVLSEQIQRQLRAPMALMILAHSLRTPHPYTPLFKSLCLQTLTCLEIVSQFYLEERDEW